MREARVDRSSAGILGSWVSCPKRQKHLIIQHLSNEDIATLVAPVFTPQHHETIMDFPVAHGADSQSQLWASQG